MVSRRVEKKTKTRCLKNVKNPVENFRWNLREILNEIFIFNGQFINTEPASQGVPFDVFFSQNL